jgi:two-component system sensor histidine kinase ChvG
VLDVVVENILDNAVGFSPDDGEIGVMLRAQGGEATLRIDDRGPGAPAEQIGRIFERSFSLRRRRGAAGDETEHAGLGLWIVRRNVEALGGRVQAENRAGGGLSQTVTLPLAK